MTSSTQVAFPKRFEKWVLLATILAHSMAFFDAHAVNIALPVLQGVFHASISQVQWVIEAYSLTLAALLLLGGALGDLYGRRFIFLVGVLLFTASSIWCGLTSTILQLITARVIQGVGAALLIPGSLAIITASFPEERRGHAIGTWGAFVSLAAAAGPVLGGWIVQHASWRWIFFLNIPIAAIVFVTTLLCVRESKTEQQNRGLDITGALLAILAFGAIIFGLLEWTSGNTVIIVAETIGVCALLEFLFVEAHVASPMVPLELFRSRTFSGASLINFFLFFTFYGTVFFLPLNLIQVQGYTPTEAGAAFLPFVLLMVLLSRWAGGLVFRFGPKLPLVIGPAITALAYALFIRCGIGNSYWLSFFPAVTVLGLGIAISAAPISTVTMNSVSLNYVGIASAINTAIGRIAGLLAIAILGLIMVAVFNHHLMKGINTNLIPIAIQEKILNQRSQLADIKVNNQYAQHLIQQSFVAGFKAVVSIELALALACSLIALVLIDRKKEHGVKRRQ